MLRSIFDLPTKKSQLESSNAGFARYDWIEKAPLRSVVDTEASRQFANGELTFRWDLAATTYFQPNKCFLRIRLKLGKVVAGAAEVAPLQIRDGIAATMGMAGALFQEGSVTIQDQTVSVCDKHMAEIETIYHRLNKPGQWMRECGQETNFWSSSFSQRQMKSCPHQVEPVNNVGGPYNPALTFASGYNTVQWNTAPLDASRNITVVDANRVVTLTSGNAVNPLWATTLATYGVIPGAVVFMTNAAGNDLQLLQVISVGPLNIVMRKMDPDAGDLSSAAANRADGVFNLRGASSEMANKVGASEIELIWMPRSLSLFRLSHALPGGAKFQLNLTPKSNYRKTAVQSLAGLEPSVAGSYELLIKDIRLYIPTFEGRPYVDNQSFYLDLNEIRCQKQTITTSESSTNITVRPSTTALACCIQDGSVETSSKWSTTEFKAEGDYQLRLQNFHTRYGAIQQPIPEFELKNDYYIDGGFPERSQLWTAVYTRNLLLSGGYFDASNESMREFFERGPYIFQIWNKSADERETRMYIKTKFDDEPSTTNAPKLVIFNFYKKHASCTIRNGRYEELHINEA